jgi:hypothetical protein
MRNESGAEFRFAMDRRRTRIRAGSEQSAVQLVRRGASSETIARTSSSVTRRRHIGWRERPYARFRAKNRDTRSSPCFSISVGQA